MKGFRTIKRTEAFSPEEMQLPHFTDKDCISSSPSHRANGSIYFMESALEILDQHIQWGQHNRTNLVEQGGFMLGNVYRDPVTKRCFAVVRMMVPMYQAQGSPVYLDMDTDAAYEATVREQEIIRNSQNPLRRVGWYHTHPGGLDVFMSGTDLQTQSKSYFHDWQFSVVLNPQRMIWRGFRGISAEEVDCVMVCDHKNPKTTVFLKHNSRYSRPVGTTCMGNSGVEPGHKPSHDPAPSAGEAHFAVEKDSVNLRDCVLSTEIFASRLYNALRINGASDKAENICVEAMLSLHTDGGKLEIFSAACRNLYINFPDGKQIHTAFHQPDALPDTLRAVVHFMKAPEEEDISEMLTRMVFHGKNEFFCAFSNMRSGLVDYCLGDSEHNHHKGTILIEK